MVLPSLQVIESRADWNFFCRSVFGSSVTATIVYLDPDGSFTSFSVAYRDRSTNEVVSKYVPIQHLFGKNAPLLREDLSFFFSNASLCILGSSYISPILYTILGVTPKVVFDPELLAQSCGINLEGLGPLVQKFMGMEVSRVEEAFQESGKRICESSSQDPYLVDLVTRDCRALYDLFEEMTRRVNRAELTPDYSMGDLLLLSSVSWEMSCTGYVVDGVRAEHLNLSLKKTLEDLEESIHRILGDHVNLGSPSQLGRALHFSKGEGGLGLPVVEKTELGAPSVSQKALESLQGAHSVVRDLLSYKRALSSYRVIQKIQGYKRGRLLYPTWLFKSGGIWSSHPCLTLISDLNALDVVTSFSGCVWVGVKYEEDKGREFSEVISSYVKPFLALEKELVERVEVFPEDLIQTYYFGILGWAVQVRKDFPRVVFEELLFLLPHSKSFKVSWGDSLGAALTFVHI